MRERALEFYYAIHREDEEINTPPKPDDLKDESQKPGDEERSMPNTSAS